MFSPHGQESAAMPVPTIKPRTTSKLSTDLLDFDQKNPRLIEDGLESPDDADIIRALADKADLAEIVESIASNGYIDIEPMIVERHGNRYRVLEGNRRLAAIRVLQDPALAKRAGVTVPGQISDAVKKSLKEVTVYAVSNPEQARDFIGFKHINGPHKWDAIAKARFAPDWYREERDKGVTIAKIAQRLGDRHDTVVRLVNGMFVLDQAEDTKTYDLRDRYPERRFAFRISIPRSHAKAIGISSVCRRNGELSSRIQTRFQRQNLKISATFCYGFMAPNRKTSSLS
jgi:hypothetical protein